MNHVIVTQKYYPNNELENDGQNIMISDASDGALIMLDLEHLQEFITALKEVASLWSSAPNTRTTWKNVH